MSPQQVQIDPDDITEASVPMAPAAVEPMNDDQALAYTQGLRKQIISTLTKGGTQLPVADRAQMQIILQAADGLDRAALGNKRIKVEEQANKTQEQAAGVIAELLQKVTSHKPFEVIDAEARVVREVPMLPAEVPPPRLVEGETATVAPQQDYETFTSQHSPNVIGERQRDS